VQQAIAAVHEHEVDLVSNVLGRDGARCAGTQEVQAQTGQRLHTQYQHLRLYGALQIRSLTLAA